MLTMSPSFSFRGPGMPWMTTSFTEMQAEPGKPPYPRKEGLAPWLSIKRRTALSISWVVTPGRTMKPARARAWAVSRPARRMASISRWDFNEIISSAIRVPAPP